MMQLVSLIPLLSPDKRDQKVALGSFIVLIFL